MTVDASTDRSILRIAIGLGGFVIIMAGMHIMSGLVNQVVLALFLTLIMAPLSRRLQKHMGANWANVLVIVLVVIIAIALLLFVVVSLGSLLKHVPSYQDGISQTGAQVSQTLASYGIQSDQVIAAVESFGKRVLQLGVVLSASMVSIGTSAVFVLLMFAFMIGDVAGMRTRFGKAFSDDNPTMKRMSHSTSAVSTYLLLLTIINLVIGVSNAIFLYIIGIPNPIFWGFVSFITGYIPFIGFWLAMIPVLIIGLVQDGWMMALIILLGYWFINGILSNVVGPKIYGRGLNLAPVVTLIAVLFWSFILGPVGGMLAVPLTAILSSVILVSYPETEWLAILMREGDGSE